MHLPDPQNRQSTFPSQSPFQVTQGLHGISTGKALPTGHAHRSPRPSATRATVPNACSKISHCGSQKNDRSARVPRSRKCGFCIDLRIFTQVLLRLLPHLPPKPHPHPSPPQRPPSWPPPRHPPRARVGGYGGLAWEVGEVADVARLA